MTELPAMPDCPAIRTRFADPDIVGDVDHIIDLGAFADPRFTERTPVDATVSTDLDVILDSDGADLRKLQMLAILSPNVTKSVRTDHRPGMNYAVRSYI